jgi:hypothetical protein
VLLVGFAEAEVEGFRELMNSMEVSDRRGGRGTKSVEVHVWVGSAFWYPKQGGLLTVMESTAAQNWPLIIQHQRCRRAAHRSSIAAVAETGPATLSPIAESCCSALQLNKLPWCMQFASVATT